MIPKNQKYALARVDVSAKIPPARLTMGNRLHRPKRWPENKEATGDTPQIAAKSAAVNAENASRDANFEAPLEERS